MESDERQKKVFIPILFFPINVPLFVQNVQLYEASCYY